jgi:hypothetical protein
MPRLRGACLNRTCPQVLGTSSVLLAYGAAVIPMAYALSFGRFTSASAAQVRMSQTRCGACALGRGQHMHMMAPAHAFSNCYIAAQEWNALFYHESCADLSSGDAYASCP